MAYPTGRAAVEARGFTLVELLVVIAIIGILASLLLPVLGPIQSKAKRAACAQSMRQIAIAAHAYADDHKRYPWSRPIVPSGRQPELDSDGDARACLEVLYRDGYVDDPQIFICAGAKTDVAADPILSPSERRERFHLEEPNGSYTWRKRITTADEDSRTPLLADRRGGEDDLANHKEGRNIGFKGTNVLFFDNEKLESRTHPDVLRARSELIGFERVGSK